MNPIKIVLADDHAIVRNGIKALLSGEKGIEVIGEASNGEEALEQVELLNPDLLIVDIRMPVMTGLEVVAKLKNIRTQTKVIVLSMHDDEEYILSAVDSGAYGYILKDTGREEFIKAIRTVFEGERYFSGDISGVLVSRYLNMKTQKPAPTISHDEPYDLTKRERQILSLIINGANNKEIADKLDKSVRTIETHRFNIMKKLDVKNAIELVRKVEDDLQLKKLIVNEVF